MISRRHLLKTLGALALLPLVPGAARARTPVDRTALKVGYARRLKGILAAGHLPYIDIESSCNPGQLDLETLARGMDSRHIGLMALSADIGGGAFRKGVRYDPLSARLLAAYPDRFIPVGNGGQPPALTEAPEAFLAAQEEAARDGQILLLGEYEFRHYPSPRQFKRGELHRDVHVPIDGPVGHRLFALSEQTDLPFQIHYEVEDGLLPPLEAMLARYPRARVIWCHLAQIRYLERGGRYTPAYVEALIGRFPNLFFDTAFGDADSLYPASNQRHARIWSEGGGLRADWRDLIAAHPRRFLSALDLGGDRLGRLYEYDANHRAFLKGLPEEARHGVAYRSAWSLLFNEEFA